MGLKKKVIINLVILLVLIIAGIKVYADVKSDLEDGKRIQTIETREELNELKGVCEEKTYMKPACAVAEISIKLMEEEYVENEECNQIEFNGVPYYLFFQKNKWMQTTEELKEMCQKRLEEQVILVWDEET